MASYFSTPLAYVFLIIFLAAAAAAPLLFGGFFERRQADLTTFFVFHPWLLLVLVPAIGMRLWAEERRVGTIELLMTLPITVWQAVLGKFLAAWAFAGLALALTFPIWVTVNMLGDPDNGVILASYIGSFLMAGAFLALSSAISALTTSQVVAFVAERLRRLPAARHRARFRGGARAQLASAICGRPDRVVFAADPLLLHHRRRAGDARNRLLPHHHPAPPVHQQRAGRVAEGGLTMRMRNPGRSSAALAVAAIVLAAVSFLAVNSIAGIVLRSARADLTEDRRFTLTGTTRSILSDLRQPVALHLYQSDALIESVPALRAYADRVREMLRAYGQLSGGKLRFELSDPQPFSTEEDSALSFGLSRHSPEQQRRARLFRPGRDEQRRRAARPSSSSTRRASSSSNTT